jgi:hypothetical protein
MTEVRRHQRQTASGKRTTVRHHTRGGDKAQRDERRPAAEDAAPPYRYCDCVGSHRPGCANGVPGGLPPLPDTPDEDEAWWDDSEPRPEPWMDDGDDGGEGRR